MHSSFTLFAGFLCFYFVTLVQLSVSVHLFSKKNVTLFGDAFFSNNSVSLTQKFSCFPMLPSWSISSDSSAGFGIGRAFYLHRVRFYDLISQTTASFSSYFSFTIVPFPPCPFGDGFAFFITSNVASVGLSDGYIGLPETNSNMPDASYLAVEFDTSFNPLLGDINDNHIGIDINTVKSSTSVNVLKEGIDLKSGKQISAWVEYRNPEKIIRIWVGYSRTRPANPLLVVRIDLTGLLKEYMHVGFSASNGKGSAAHIINSWRFKTAGLNPPSSQMETVEDGGCIICHPGDTNGQDVLEVKPKKNRGGRFVLDVALGCLGLAAFVSSMIAIFITCFKSVMRRINIQGRDKQMFIISQKIQVPRRLSLGEIRAATEGFNQSRIIGEGASATVYEGSLSSCGPVAVKRFIQVNHPTIPRSQFTTELATLVGCLRHRNLVQLQGWCCEKNEMILVFEYMPNGSLDKILHKRSSASKHLTWERRQNIVQGVASALIYLHEECEQQVIHRDVKTCNIMLDADFNAKLGDFGLAEVYGHSSSLRDATLPAGTMGYLAPEYVYTGIPTVKVDVYSFGVVVLEVASGRKPVDEEGTPVTDWIWDMWEKGTLIGAVDHKLKGCFDKMEAERMLMAGLCCAHPNHLKRPIMKEAARMLKGESPLPKFPERKPTVRIGSSSFPGGSTFDFSKYLGHSLFEDVNDTPWSTPETHFS